MEQKPAIVLVAFKRLKPLKRLLACIENGIYQEEDITLIISIDYSESNEDVIQCAQEFQWRYGNKIVKTHKKNLGLKRHILECGDYTLQYGSIILLEDDLLVAPYYYQYAKKAQEFYKTDVRIAGVSLYGHEWNGYAGKKFVPLKKNGDIYFGQFSCTWGESWTEKQWTNFKNWYAECPQLVKNGSLPEQIYNWKESWGKFFAQYIVEKGLYYIIPYKSLSTTTGEEGIHCSQDMYNTQVCLNLGNNELKFVSFEEGNHYDIFFENVDLQDSLEHVLETKDICIDLYETKGKDYSNHRYILTTKHLNYKIIQSFSLNLRPHEMNIVWNIEGDDIFLYDRKYAEKNKNKKKNRILYDFAGQNSVRALEYFCKRFWIKHFKKEKSN